MEVRSSGGKSLSVRYRDSHNRQCQLRICQHGEMSFDRIRKKAEEIRARILLWEPLSKNKKLKKKIPTLSHFVQFHYLPFIKKDKRSWKADDSMLRCHILPAFGNKHLDRITTQAVIDFHHGMVTKGLAKGTANRGLVLLKYMFNLAIKWQIPGVTFNPAAGIKLFEANNTRERYLTVEETQRLLAAVRRARTPN